MTCCPCYVLTVFGVLILSSAIVPHAQGTQQIRAPQQKALHEIDVPVSRLEIEAHVKRVPNMASQKDEEHETAALQELEAQYEELDNAHRLAPVASHQSVAADRKPFRQLTNGSTPTGWIQIGTPKKWLRVIFDTGSDKLVAKTWDTVAKELESIDQGVAGMVSPSDSIYSDLNSSTYHRKYVMGLDGEMVPKESSITYGSGSVSTDEGTENVLIGNRNLDNFTVMEVTSDSLQLLHDKKGISGILGLQHMKNKSLGNSLFSRMRDADLLTSFGYCHGTGNNGTFIWGDDSKEGQELDVFGQMHWALKLGDVKIPANEGSGSLVAKSGTRVLTSDGKWSDTSHSNGNALSDMADEMVREGTVTLANTCPDSKCTAILDTGSNIIAGPSEAIKSIINLVNVKSDCSNFDDLPNIKMTLGGMEVSIPPSGYVMKVHKPSGADAEGAEDGQGELDRETEDLDARPARYADVAIDVGPGYLRRDLPKVSEHEMSLAEKRVSRVRAVTNRRWKGVFERLHRNYGVDLRKTVEILLQQHNSTSEEFICMPALVPLDKGTVNGPLWIVGTPLLDAYYARWSFAKDDSSPKIHLKALQDADVCKDGQEPANAANAANPVNPVVSSDFPILVRTPRVGSDTDDKAAALSHKRGPTPRLPEEIAYPHWARDLTHV